MKSIKSKDGYLLVLDRGERLIESLENFCYKKHIFGGRVIGIGGVRKTTLAFFDLPTKTYEKRHVEGPAELVSLVGNIAKAGNGLKVHCHSVICGPDFHCLGGHLIESEVNITAELSIIPSKAVHRSLDQRTGLMLISHG